MDELLKLPISRITTSFNLTGFWRDGPCPEFVPKIAPCKHGCPLNQDIAEAIEFIRKNKIKDAWKLWTESNPLPSVCGRVCRHFCEEKCCRQDYGGAIKIGNIERFLGDIGLEKEWVFNFPKNRSSKQKIAVIGAGPAGLATVYFLRKNGLRVELLEKERNFGGFSRLIPDYRLPKRVLTEEIERILRPQKLNQIQILNQISLEETFVKNVLTNDFYGAVLIASGAGVKNCLNIPGENFPGAINGLDFLAGERPEIAPKKIIIIGGGNTGIDAGRTARRIYPLAEIKIICPEDRDAMPAYKTEIDAALSENIKIKNCLLPLEIKETDNELEIKFCEPKILLAENKEIYFLPTDSFYFEETDLTITAIGTKSQNPFLRHLSEGQKEKVFVIGDASKRFSSVSKVMASAKNTVSEVIKFLETGERNVEQKKQPVVATINNINLDYFKKESPLRDNLRYLHSHQLNKEIAGNFSELTETWTEYAVKKEVERCFSCGICVDCDNCYEFCPDMAVMKIGENDKMIYEIDEKYCKGCGICAKECPRGILEV